MLQINFLFSILSCILYSCIFFSPGRYLAWVSHSYRPFWAALPNSILIIFIIIIIIIIIYFLDICNFMVTKPNKVKKYIYIYLGIIYERKASEFRYLRTITNSPLVASPIKMQDLHWSTIWVILILQYFSVLSGAYSVM